MKRLHDIPGTTIEGGPASFFETMLAAPVFRQDRATPSVLDYYERLFQSVVRDQLPHVVVYPRRIRGSFRFDE